jgi:hypothetical protein
MPKKVPEIIVAVGAFVCMIVNPAEEFLSLSDVVKGRRRQSPGKKHFKR